MPNGEQQKPLPSRSPDYVVWAVFQGAKNLVSLHQYRLDALKEVLRLRYKGEEEARNHYLLTGYTDYVYGYDSEGALFEPVCYEVRPIVVHGSK